MRAFTLSMNAVKGEFAKYDQFTLRGKIMALADNIRLGESAVREVKGLGVLACNKLGDRLKAAGGVDNVVGYGYDDTAGAGVDRTRSAGVRTMTIGNMRGTAEHVRNTKYGNCWEQAIIAFVHLYDKGLRPLDLMQFTTAGYDHVWVGIGLHPGWQSNNLRSWGPDAVWCDPWQGDGVVFAVSDLVKGAVRNLNAIYKCNTCELVEAGMPLSLIRVD
ncbi:hypothetical protein [Paraburkholderia diazotrophica]|nr:hypothetical protein [Paraburkholderia diazotrophica]